MELKQNMNDTGTIWYHEIVLNIYSINYYIESIRLYKITCIQILLDNIWKVKQGTRENFNNRFAI